MNRPSKYTYAAVFTPEADGAYSIRFPHGSMRPLNVEGSTTRRFSRAL